MNARDLAFNRPSLNRPPLTSAKAPAGTLRPAATLPPKPSSMVEAKPGDHLVLMPGQLHFGRTAASMRTLLGSCVAITLWHPAKRFGGMCHFLLPERARTAGMPLEGRFGTEAVELMVQALSRLGTRPEEYVAHLYGGADTMPEGAKVKLNIGERNIERGWALIDQYGFQLDGVDVGDNVPRTVLLDCEAGDVQVRRSNRI